MSTEGTDARGESAYVRELQGRVDRAETALVQYKDEVETILWRIHAEADAWLKHGGDPRLTIDEIFEASALHEVSP